MTNKGFIEQFIQLNNKTTRLKMGKGTEQIIFRKGCTGDQQAREKVLSIANHQRNANQNHNEILPHTCQDAYHQKEHK